MTRNKIISVFITTLKQLLPPPHQKKKKNYLKLLKETENSHTK